MNLLLFIIISIVTPEPITHYQESLKTYSVKKIAETIRLSGKGDHPVWKHASELHDFSYPWNEGIPPSTRFRALHNEGWVYCLFEVTDPGVSVMEVTNNKWEVASSSRAEIFFRIDDQLKPYYCLEIDPLGRVLDYQGTYHRHFDLTWSWPPGGLIIKTQRRTDGYTIEAAISKKSLEKLGLLKKTKHCRRACTARIVYRESKTSVIFVGSVG